MTDALIEKVARAINDIYADFEIAHFEASRKAARAALAAIEESGTHVVVLSEDIRELGSDLIEICDHHIASAAALGRQDLAERLRIARAAISAGIGASPKVTP